MTAMMYVCGSLAAILFALGNTALAQEFSGRVVTMTVNNTAGGPTDIEARIAARHLLKHLSGLMLESLSCVLLSVRVPMPLDRLARSV